MAISFKGLKIDASEVGVSVGRGARNVSFDDADISGTQTAIRVHSDADVAFENITLRKSKNGVVIFDETSGREFEVPFELTEVIKISDDLRGLPAKKRERFFQGTGLGAWLVDHGYPVASIIIALVGLRQSGI